jgi:hypothetical protein
MVEVTCDLCGRSLPDEHIEVFRYVADDDDGDIVELGYDLCSPECHLTWTLNQAWSKTPTE